MFYSLINYFDVWGNPADGFEINNQRIEREAVEIPEDWTAKKIVTWLFENGFLTTADMRKLRVEEYGEVIEIQKKNRFPLFAFTPNYHYTPAKATQPESVKR